MNFRLNPKVKCRFEAIFTDARHIKLGWIWARALKLDFNDLFVLPVSTKETKSVASQEHQTIQQQAWMVHEDKG